jgi:Tol biopolymer transport system component
LVASEQVTNAMSWSADGRFVLYRSNDSQTNGDLWVVPTAGDRTPWLFVGTAFREAHGMFSPDGRWVAYQSDESGRPQIWVRAFVPPGGGSSVAGSPWQVSNEGGINPVWRHDGKELFYLNPSGAMMAAPVTVNGSAIQTHAPVRLFATRIVGGGVDALQGRHYDVAADGRFLINTELGGTASPITLVMNWNPAAQH